MPRNVTVLSVKITSR